MKTIVLVIPMLLFCGAVHADRFCFTYAENYYEQIYCEVQASGQGKDLPGFYDFRRNDEMMQALCRTKVSPGGQSHQSTT